MNDLSSSLLCPFIKIDDKNDKKKKNCYENNGILIHS